MSRGDQVERQWRIMQILLSSHYGKTVKELAERFECSQRTIYRDPHWRDGVLFYEYFHGDSGAGLGASHQTGWTGLVAELIQRCGGGSCEFNADGVFG